MDIFSYSEWYLHFTYIYELGGFGLESILFYKVPVLSVKLRK